MKRIRPVLEVMGVAIAMLVMLLVSASAVMAASVESAIAKAIRGPASTARRRGRLVNLASTAKVQKPSFPHDGALRVTVTKFPPPWRSTQPATQPQYFFRDPESLYPVH